MKNFENYILDLKQNEPILIKDVISTFSYSKKEITIRKEIERMVNNGQLTRVARGIYMKPSYSITGKIKTLDPIPLIENEYLFDNNKKIGYYTGITLLNKLGLSYQVPNIKEIVTNKESSRKRETNFCNRTIILRKPRLEINDENVDLLQLLDLVSIYDKYSDIDKKKAKELILKYYRNKKITKEKIINTLEYYPNKTSKEFIKGGFIYEFA